MAIKTVVATLSAYKDGSQVSTDIFSPTPMVLTSTGVEGEYQITGIQAPNMSSYNLDQNVFYLSVTATTEGGKQTTINQDDTTFGNDCKLRVKERNAPAITIDSPSSEGTYINNTALPDFSIQFSATDESVLGGIKDSGIKLDSLILKIERDSVVTTIRYGDAGLSKGESSNGYIFSYKPVEGFESGEYKISISISDNDGNPSTEVSRSFIIDVQAPSITISAETPRNVKNVSVNGTTDDIDGITVVIEVDNVEKSYHQEYTLTNITTSNFSQNVALEEGTNIISAYATDKAGNISPKTSTEVLVDTTIPVFEIVEIKPNPADNGETLTIKVRVKSVFQNE